MTDPIVDWAERYSEQLDRKRTQRSFTAQRARLLMAGRAARKSERSKRRAFAVAATCVAVLSSLALFFSFDRISAEKPTLAGQVIDQNSAIETRGEPTELVFPHGSRVVWKANSRGSLAEYSDKQVELKLDAGSMTLDVAHKAGRTWLVRAGDFRVQVVGTAFSVDYDRDSGGIEVRVARGRVRVEGQHVGGGGIFLVAGQRYVWHPERAVQLAPSLRDSDSPRDPVADAKSEAKQAVSRPRAQETAPSWQEWAKQGKYDRALLAVEKNGLDRTLAQANSEELVLLGNAARFGGRSDLARRAYLAARRETGSAAALSAFYLAKMALDGGQNRTEAVRWLRVYLKEAKMGGLAATARARLMTLLEQSGDHAGAVAVAREYLSLHPNGPYADQAQSLLASP